MAILASTFKTMQRAGGRQFEVQILDELSKTLTAVTATETSDVIDLGDNTTLRLFLDVSAASGTTPTLNVSIEHSHDGTTFAALASFAEKTAVASERKTFGPCNRYVRAVYTIAGTTPSFTKTLTGFGV